MAYQRFVDSFSFTDMMNCLPTSFNEENMPVWNSILKTIFENYDSIFSNELNSIEFLRDPRFLNKDSLLLLLQNLGFYWNNSGKIEEKALRYLAEYLPYYYKIAGSGAVCIRDTSKINNVWILNISKLDKNTILGNSWG